MATPSKEATERTRLAADIARDAGALIRTKGAGTFGVTTKSSATDMVTEVDKAVEALIADHLGRARPDDGINGEEGASCEGTTGVVWQVDPIDGTTNFVYGYPGFAVSLAAEWHGAAIAAAVYDVVRDELFTATKDGGAWRDGAAIRCTDAHSIAAALVATGFSYEPERRARQAHVLTAVLPAVRDIRRGGAASTDLCAVACGRVDAYYERGLQPWDHAAGALIAAEAGAIVGDLDGGQPSWEFTLAAAPALFDALRTILCDAGARDA